MDMYIEVSKALNQRKSEWTAFSEITGISRKTIERIAAQKHDTRYSNLSRLYELLKLSA